MLVGIVVPLGAFCLCCIIEYVIKSSPIELVAYDNYYNSNYQDRCNDCYDFLYFTTQPQTNTSTVTYSLFNKPSDNFRSHLLLLYTFQSFTGTISENEV